MKKIALLATLLFSVMFPSASFAEWTRMSENERGTTYYLDFERIRKVDGYVYWWTLSDSLKPNQSGAFSAKVYMQSDCKLFRSKSISLSFHKEPMGGGLGESVSPKDPKWRYPPPNSAFEASLKAVCDHVK